MEFYFVFQNFYYIFVKILSMKIFTEKPLIDFIEKHPQMRVVLQDWVDKIKKAEWLCLDNITTDFDNVEVKDKQTAIFHYKIGGKLLNISIMFIGKFVYVRELGVRS